MQYPSLIQSKLPIVLLFVFAYTSILSLEMFTDYSEFDNDTEDYIILQSILDSGININTVSIEELEILGLDRNEIDELVKLREMNDDITVSDLRAKLSIGNKLFVYEEYLLLSDKRDFKAKSVITGKMTDGKYRISTIEELKVNNCVTSLSVNNDRIKFCSYSKQLGLLDYSLGSFKYNFGNGLILQATQRTGIYYTPEISLWSDKRYAGGLIKLQHKALTVNAFCLSDAKIPEQTIVTPEQDRTAEISGITLKYKTVSLLASRQTIQGERERYFYSFFYQCNSKFGSIELEGIINEKPSISSKVVTKYKQFKQTVKINHVNESQKRPFSNYYNDFYYYDSFQCFLWKIERIGFIKPEIDISYYKSSEYKHIKSSKKIGIKVGTDSYVKLYLKHIDRVGTEELKFGMETGATISKMLRNRTVFSFLNKADKRSYSLLSRFYLTFSKANCFFEIKATKSEINLYSSNDYLEYNEITVNDIFTIAGGLNYSPIEVITVNAVIKKQLSSNEMNARITLYVRI